MNIGFDLDGVFIDKPPFISKRLIEWLYRGHDHRLFYRIPSKTEQFIRILTHYPIFRPALRRNVEFIKRLNNDSNKYYLISSRFGFLKDRTESIVNRYQLVDIFYKMYFNFDDNQPHVFKEKMLRKLVIDRYVDDDLPLLKFLAKRNSGIMFYWLNDKTVKSLDNNLFAISDLSDIIKR